MRSFNGFVRVVVFAWAFCGLASIADGVLIINGATSTVANGFTNSHGGGSHFHSVTDPNVLPTTNPGLSIPGAAEVGGFFGDEEVQGVSEFTLQAGNADLILLLFDVRDNSDIDIDHPISGLFGQEPLDGIVDVYTYDADHVESVSDFVSLADRPTEAPLVSIEVATLLAGDTISVNITPIYNMLVDNDEEALGVRLLSRVPNPTATPQEQLDALEEAGAITFENFRLELTNPVGVPEPSPLLFLGLVCLALSGVARYRRLR